MLRTTLLLVMIFWYAAGIAQTAKTDPSLAKVNIVVTDMSGKASKGEQIVFKPNTKEKTFSGYTGADGKFSIQLPIGDQYTISVKSLEDSTKYGILDIPALQPDQVYNEPFSVVIKFEPAHSYTLNNVHFDVNKATLRPDSYTSLNELLNYLKHKETVKIEIGGHTDNVGKDAENLKLSQQRAEAIRAYLVKKGIPPTRIIAKGYGATQPIADNESEEGRQMNRRTEVKIL